MKGINLSLSLMIKFSMVQAKGVFGFVNSLPQPQPQPLPPMDGEPNPPNTIKASPSCTSITSRGKIIFFTINLIF